MVSDSKAIDETKARSDEGPAAPAGPDGGAASRGARLAAGLQRRTLLRLDAPPVVALVIFLLALAPRLLDLGVFVGPDEFSWVNRSAAFARALAGGNLAGTYQTGHPGVTLLWVETLGAWLRAGFHLPDAPTGAGNSMAALAAGRQTVAVVNALLVGASAWLACRLFGSGVAWMMGILLAFDPFLLTESRALRTEGLLTGFSTVALLSLLRYRQEPRLRFGALAGLLTGLALLSKVSAAALLPVGALVIGAAALPDPQRRWRRAALAGLVWAGILLLTVAALWPALWVDPAGVARKMTDYVAFRAVEGGGGGKSFFLGQPTPSEELSFLFYPLVLLYRTNPWLWPGLVLLAAAVWRGRGDARRRYALPEVALIGLYLVTYLILIARSDLKYDRYAIPMLPGLAVLSALGYVAGWRGLAAQSRAPRLERFGWLAAALLLAGQIGLALPHHPYYYTFWNPLLGGPRSAARVLPVGIAGEGIEQVVAYLNARPAAETLTLASANSQKVRPIFKGQTISMTNVDGEWFTADYTLIYISQLQRGKHDPEIVEYLQRKPLEFTLDLAGLDYGWLYRGPGAQYFGGDGKLEGLARLHAYDLSAAELPAGEPLTVTVYFRNEGQQPGDRFYARLVDADGYVWAGADVLPRPGFEEAFHTRKALVEGEATLSLPPGMIPGPYQLRLGFERAPGGGPIGAFTLPAAHDTVEVTLPARFPPAAGSRAPLAVAGDELGLLAFDLAPAAGDPAAGRWLTLHWRALTDVRHDYVLLLRLLDDRGEEAAYWLGRPARSALPTDRWRAGQPVQDPWLLRLPPDRPGGDYSLELAVFDAGSEAEVARFSLGTVTMP